MDAATHSTKSPMRRLLVRVAAGYALFAMFATAFQATGEDRSKLLPEGDGTQSRREPVYTTDPNDPFPMPPDMAGVNLMAQTAEQAHAKSYGCIVCHQNSHDPHYKETVKIGCTDCHGGDATAAVKEAAHVKARYPQFWPTAANPQRSYTLLNHEAPEFIRFINPGDFRVAHIGCGTSGCHPKEVQTNRKQIMATGCMLWGAALYNNGAVPFKKARYGEAYGMNGAPLRILSNPPPSEEETKTKGVLPFLEPLPRYENSQPGNILRIFEPGGRFNLEVGQPELKEEPGRPRTKLSVRGIGTQNRTDPVFIGLNKTRLFDPTLNFLGTNDQPGDYRSSGCTACHVVYANDRSPIHSAQYAKFGNLGKSHSDDPTINKNESGHPIQHRFTNSIPTSQCMICHIHPGTTVMNSYIGYMWDDHETEARLLYPKEQKDPTATEFIRNSMKNPDAASARGNWSDPEFLANLTDLNAYSNKVQFGDFHSHGWMFRAVFKKDRQGFLRDHDGELCGPPTAEMLQKAIAFPIKMKDFHKNDASTTLKAAVEAEAKVNCDRKGQPVHLMDIHMEKGMHCVDCHFSQDMHGNNRLHQEVRAATEISCIDCHGSASKYTTLKTSGPAAYTSAPDGQGRNLAALKTPYGKPRFEVQDLGGGKQRIVQNSMVEKDLKWEVVQTKDTISKDHPRYNAKSALAKTVRVENGSMVFGELKDGQKCAHTDSNMSCIACHTSWNPSCFGCHLPQKANVKAPQLHADGDVTKNLTDYNWMTLQDNVFMLARDGTVTGNRINPARSSCAIHVGSYNANRESIYVQQQTISAEGFGGTAFSTNVPHTVRGKGARETKQCTDCHVSDKNDNNAIMAQLLMHGTNSVNLIGKFTWIAAGAEGLFGVNVTEQTEPQAVYGSDLHAYAYPQNYARHAASGGILQHAHEHPGLDIKDELKRPFKEADILMVQNRGEYLYAACGKDGIRIFDIAFIDDKAFAERITTAPVSPKGQKFHVPTKNARYIATPTTVAVDPTRTQKPENQEQKHHLIFGFLYVADEEEGLILVGAATTIDGNPVNNFLKREVTFNPEGILCGARYVQIVGHYAYVLCNSGLVVVDLEDPTKPKIASINKDVHDGTCVQVQFRYAYVTDHDGVKVFDVSDYARPVPKSMIRLEHAKSIYLARTYAYVAAGKQGLVILNITNAEEPKIDQTFNPGGVMNDVHDVKLGITYVSQFAYVADGKNGLRVVQLTSPETPGNEGFSPRPTPRLVATFKPKHGEVLSVAKGLDRDRAVDESGHQIGVFGRVGARPLQFLEQQKMYIRDGKVWTVSDDPKSSLYMQK
ncbi:hypothetical protein BH11PLA2_BH11PLA2_41220 [soil metagenome]